MKIEKIYQVVAYVVKDNYPDWTDDSYEFTLVTTTNKHFAQLVERIYQEMIDAGTPSVYLQDKCFHGLWNTDEIYTNTLKCFM